MRRLSPVLVGSLNSSNSSSGDQARVINNAGGEVKIAGLATDGTSFGSIEGAAGRLILAPSN